MFSFNKKDNSSKSVEDDSLKKVTESLYKQNLELAVKNRTFSLLRKLYQISILALEPEPLAEKVVTTVREALEFDLVGIFIFDEQKTQVLPLAFSMSERLKNASQKNNITFSCVIGNVNENIFFSKLLGKESISHVNNLGDIWKECISEEQQEKILKEVPIKSSSGFLLTIDKKPLGILIISFNRHFEELAQYERDSIASFVEVIAVALDKSTLYKQLKVTNIKLKEANEGQISLMHIMNHQIKGRLGNTRNIFAELLTDDYGTMPENVKPLLQKGLEESETGVNYVQTILKGVSAENGSLPYDMQPISLKDIVTEVFEKQKEKAQAKGLTYEIDLGNGNYIAQGDSTQLKEALRNLIDNSIYYTPSGSIKIKLLRKIDKIIFSIKDTGVGITAEDMPKLFKSGGRGKDSIKINVNSTGYGLAFVKGVIEAHKGKVWVESQGENKGSTFYVELPALST